MKRKIIEINPDKCNGCGLCIQACHEGAIGLKNGKATLLRDDYCDGLGDCLPACPTGAISFTEREASAYDEAAVLKNKQSQQKAALFTCPGTKVSLLQNKEAATAPKEHKVSQLRQWPCQIKLTPVRAAFFNKAKLLIAADCSSYAYANMHDDFMHGKVTLIGCPKLDNIDYSEKLTDIITENDIQSVTVIRMEVPCCGGLENAVKAALQASSKFIPWQIVTISVDGRILE